MKPEPPSSTDAEDNAGGPSSSAPGFLGSAMTALGQSIGVLGPVVLPLRGLGQAFSALGNANYRLVWGGALISNIGSWMQNIARDWLIYELSGVSGKFWLGLNGFAEGVAVTVVLPLGGVLADRWNRKTLIILSNALEAVLAGILTVLALTGTIAPWHILAMTALNGACEGLRIPATQSLLPSLVPRRDMPNAMALGSLQFNFSRVIGPALGGLTLATCGAAWSFGINALSFLAVIAAAARLKLVAREVSPTQPVGQSLRQALSYARRRADILMILTLVVATGLLVAPALKMAPALAKEALGGQEGLFAQLLSWFGGGAVIGAMLMALRSRRGPTPWRAAPLLLLLGLTELSLGFVTVRWLAFVLFALIGMLFIGIMVRLNTAVLYSSPDEVRGRMSSFQMLAFRAGIPAGALLAGWLAAWSNIRWTFWSFGATLTLAGAIAIMVSRSIAWQAEFVSLDQHEESSGD